MRRRLLAVYVAGFSLITSPEVTELLDSCITVPSTSPPAFGPLPLRSPAGLAQTQVAGAAVDVALGSTAVPVTPEQSLISIAAISSPAKTQKWRKSSNERARPW